MKAIWFTPWVLGVFLSCSSVIDLNKPVPQSQSGKFESYRVPDGFDYKSTGRHKVIIDPFGDSDPVSSTFGAFYRLYSTAEDTILLREGFVRNKSIIEQEIELANHVEGLLLKLQVNGISYNIFEEKKSTVRFDIPSMQTGGFNVRNNTKNCIPALVGVDWELWKDGNTVIIIFTEDKAISNIVFNILDRDHLKIEDPRLYNGVIKETSWELPVEAFDFTVEEIEGIWVKSGCNFSGDGPGYGEYIINPYYTHIDVDGDDIPDLVDADTYADDVLATAYYPAQGEYWTYAFEDNWPYMADYDFNDLVIYYNYSIFIDEKDMVTGFSYRLIVEAIGASFDNDFSLSFSGDHQQVTVDELESYDLSVTKHFNGEYTELRFNNLRSLYEREGFINTDESKEYITPKELTGIVTLHNRVPVSEFSLEGFLRVDQQAGREVHMADYPGSVEVDVTLFGKANDDTNPDVGKYYKSALNHPWAINIPDQWQYPQEHEDVTLAYLRFAEFATSNPLIDWYSSKPTNKGRGKLYGKGRWK